MKSQTISVQIDRPPSEVYAFASKPEDRRGLHVDQPRQQGNVHFERYW